MNQYQLTNKNEAPNLWSVLSLLTIIALTVFCIHLMNRHNRLHMQYTSCMNTVQLLADWKEAQK